MNRKMEQKNKSNRCSSLFSSGIYITFCTGIYKNIGKFEIEFSFAVISSCLNKQTNKWVFPSVDKVATNFGCDFVIQQPLKSTRQCTINNNDTKKVDQHCIKTRFTSLETSSFALFFQVMKKSLLFLTLSSSLSSPFAFLSFFFVCFNHSQTQ